MGTELWRSYVLCLLAESCERAERIDEGMEAVAEALVIARNNAEHWCEAEVYRLKGALLLR